MFFYFFRESKRQLRRLLFRKQQAFQVENPALKGEPGKRCRNLFETKVDGAC